MRVLDQALATVSSLEIEKGASPLAQLKAAARWTMQGQLAGEMPSLPAQNSALRRALMAHAQYLAS